MTEPSYAPSEAEVEAATQVMNSQLPDEPSIDIIRHVARAALTAAAQVRERADMEALQRAAARDRPMICRWCNQMHRGGPENCNNPDATYTKAQSTQPDLLGMRKGEE